MIDTAWGFGLRSHQGPREWRRLATSKDVRKGEGWGAGRGVCHLRRVCLCRVASQSLCVRDGVLVRVYVRVVTRVCVVPGAGRAGCCQSVCVVKY